MDDRTRPYPAVDRLYTQPTLLDQDWRLIEDCHVRARQAEARRAVERERKEAPDTVVASRYDTDASHTFAAPLVRR